jgi:dihydrofolate reductase
MMRKIIASLFISLDGVVEEPGDWHFPYFNDEMGAAVDAVLGSADTLLLGRKTYDDHAGAWPELEAAGGEDAEFAKVLGDARKIVVSCQRLELTWRNSEQLQGDLVEAMTALKNQLGDGNIATSGSISVVRERWMNCLLLRPSAACSRPGCWSRTGDQYNTVRPHSALGYRTQPSTPEPWTTNQPAL